MRVSAYPKSFDDARARCETEGSDLTYIVDQSMQDGIEALIAKKKALFKHFEDTDYFWLGGIVNNQKEWSWISTFQTFTEYTNWQLSSPGYGCSGIGCSGSERLTLQVSKGHDWKAVERTEEHPYICTSKCKYGYRWFARVKRCLRVEATGVGSTSSAGLPRAMLTCGLDGGQLAPLKSCDELPLLAEDMREFGHPENQVYLVGNFYNLHSKWSKRHLITDPLTDSYETGFIYQQASFKIFLSI